MNIKKPILYKTRQIPKSFSWIDHRFIQDDYVDKCSHQALALYLFLICVSDRQGISYYSNKSICRRLKMKDRILVEARRELLMNNLLNWKSPFYQILDLSQRNLSKRGKSELFKLSEIFKMATEGKK